MAAMTQPNSSTNFSGMDAAKMLALLYRYDQANTDKGSATGQFGEASSVYSDAAGRTNTYMDAIAEALMKMNGSGGMTTNTLPSTNGGGVAYTDAAKYGDPSQVLLPMLGEDRGNMLQQLMQANDLTTRQVNIGDYSVKNVKNRADQKFSALAPSIDRAASIASSAGFGDALKRGVADSTQAVDMRGDLTRKFGDVYSKLRQQADDSALADNAAMYQSYLGGKGAQVQQNTMLGQLANQLFGTTAQVAGNTMNGYNNSANGVADRLIRALNGADSASIQNTSVNNNAFAPLLSALVNLNNQNIQTAQNRFTSAGTAAGTASTNQGTRLEQLVGSAMQAPWVQQLMNRGFDWATNKTNPSFNENYGNEGRNYPAPNDTNQVPDSSWQMPDTSVAPPGVTYDYVIE